MPNPFGAPEISVEEVSALQNHLVSITLMDVREPNELLLANLGDDVVNVPLSLLARSREAALPDALMDKESQIIVFCHTGVRSAQVTAWLRSMGWQNAWSMAGGIEAYARQIDPKVGFY